MNNFIVMPPEMGSEPHDMLVGPCACGATHALTDWPEEIRRVATRTAPETVAGEPETEYDRLKIQYDCMKANEEEKLRNEGRSSVVMIRCTECLSVPQQNAKEGNGCECGGCIAKERDAARSDHAWLSLHYEDLLKVTGNLASVLNDPRMEYSGTNHMREGHAAIAGWNNFDRSGKAPTPPADKDAEIAKLREEASDWRATAQRQKANYEDLLRASQQHLTIARATIAERDKRIAGLIGALTKLLKLRKNCEGDIGWRGKPNAIVDYIRVKHILLIEAALDHAAEGKEQA